MLNMFNTVYKSAALGAFGHPSGRHNYCSQFHYVAQQFVADQYNGKMKIISLRIHNALLTKM